jgi:glutamine synthetase
MLLMPDATTANMDPFREEPTLILTCDVVEPSTARATTAIRARSPSAPRPT